MKRRMIAAGLALLVWVGAAGAAVGKGKDTAPGQADNFDRGTTTIVSDGPLITEAGPDQVTETPETKACAIPHGGQQTRIRTTVQTGNVITYFIRTTTLHHGAPNSKGKVYSVTEEKIVVSETPGKTITTTTGWGACKK